MQQYQKTICEKIYIGVAGTAWVTGLLIAGSDSSYMPWFNGIGLMLFFGASVLLGKLVQVSGEDMPGVVTSESNQKAGINAIGSQNRIQRLHTQYAMEVRKNRCSRNLYSRDTSTVTLRWCCPPPGTVHFNGVGLL